jgi:hypothetical protein
MAEPREGVRAGGLGQPDEVRAGAVEVQGVAAAAGSHRDAVVGPDGARADRARPGAVGGRRDGRTRSSSLRPLESAVDGEPFAVLAGLAVAGRKGRQACGTRGDAVALAVRERLRTDLVLGERCPGHDPECARSLVIMSTCYDNPYNMY